MMIWKTLVRVELKRHSLPIVEPVLARLKQPPNLCTLSHDDFKTRLSMAFEGYVLLLKGHYNGVLLENFERVLIDQIDQIMSDVTRSS